MKVKRKMKPKKNEKMKSKNDDKMLDSKIEKVDIDQQSANNVDNKITLGDDSVAKKGDKETGVGGTVSGPQVEVEVAVGNILNPLGLRTVVGAPIITPTPVPAPISTPIHTPAPILTPPHAHNVLPSLIESAPKIQSETLKNLIRHEKESETETENTKNPPVTEKINPFSVLPENLRPLIPRGSHDDFTSPSKSILRYNSDVDLRDPATGILRGKEVKDEKEKDKEKDGRHGFGYGNEKGSSRKLDGNKGDKDGQDGILPLSSLLLPADPDTEIKSDDAGITVKRGVSRKRGSILSLFGWSSSGGTGAGAGAGAGSGTVTGAGTGAGSAVSVASTNSGLESASHGSRSHDEESLGGSISPTVASPTLMGIGMGIGMGMGMSTGMGTGMETMQSHCPPSFPLLPPGLVSTSSSSSAATAVPSLSHPHSHTCSSTPSSYPSSPSTRPAFTAPQLPLPPYSLPRSLPPYPLPTMSHPTTPTPSSPPSRTNVSSIFRFSASENIIATISPRKEHSSDDLMVKSAAKSSGIGGGISHKGVDDKTGDSKDENQGNNDEEEEGEEGSEGDEEGEEDEEVEEEETEEDFYSPNTDPHKDSTPRTERILVPQILPVLFACLPSVTSLDLVQSTVLMLEKSVTNPLPLSPSIQRKGFFKESKSVTATPERTHGLFSRSTEVRTFMQRINFLFLFSNNFFVREIMEYRVNLRYFGFRMLLGIV